MSNVVELLEIIGADASLQNLDSRSLKNVFSDVDISEELQLAILEGDVLRIREILGAETNVMCVLFPAEDDETGDDDTGDDDDADTTESKTVVNF